VLQPAITSSVSAATQVHTLGTQKTSPYAGDNPLHILLTRQLLRPDENAMKTGSEWTPGPWDLRVQIAWRRVLPDLQKVREASESVLAISLGSRMKQIRLDIKTYRDLAGENLPLYHLRFKM
jgi:hypothetical protein